ncbi:hypothetical protein AAZX31_16G019800 [Glycine max]
MWFASMFSFVISVLNDGTMTCRDTPYKCNCYTAFSLDLHLTWLFCGASWFHNI